MIPKIAFCTKQYLDKKNVKHLNVIKNKNWFTFPD